MFRPSKIYSSRETDSVKRFFDTGGSLISAGKLPQVLLTTAANLPPVSTRPAVSVEKFTAGVVNTGGAP
jgi:hypothetical protein